MNNDDDLAFDQMLEGVKKLSVEPRAPRQSPANDKTTIENRRAAAVKVTEADQGLSTEYAPPVGGLDLLCYQRPGVQHGVFKKLRLGQYPAEATLDLHRRTVEQARQDILDFIKESSRLGLRSLLINHGKAIHGNVKQATIKSFVNLWLPQMDVVLAFHSAQTHHGGTGACYVLLKKGEKQKLESRERFAKRGN